MSETNGQIINIAGPEELSPNDVAAVFTAAFGETVNAVAVPDEQLDSHFGALFNPITAAAWSEMLKGWNTGLIAWEEGIKADKGQTGLDKVVSS